MNEGYMGQFLGMCRWPLRTPFPIILYSLDNWPFISQIVCDPKLADCGTL